MSDQQWNRAGWLAAALWVLVVFGLSQVFPHSLSWEDRYSNRRDDGIGPGAWLAAAGVGIALIVGYGVPWIKKK